MHVDRIFEEELHTSVDARTESLQTLRELGPPDLVHLVKQPIKGTSRQVYTTPLLERRAGDADEMLKMDY